MKKIIALFFVGALSFGFGCSKSGSDNNPTAVATGGAPSAIQGTYNGTIKIKGRADQAIKVVITKQEGEAADAWSGTWEAAGITGGQIGGTIKNDGVLSFTLGGNCTPPGITVNTGGSGKFSNKKTIELFMDKSNSVYCTTEKIPAGKGSITVNK